MGFRRHYQKHITLSFLTHARVDAARGLTCSSIPSDSRDPFSFLYNKRFFFPSSLGFSQTVLLSPEKPLRR